MSKPHEGLPVAGYQPQSDKAVDTVNSNKRLEERLLRLMDRMAGDQQFDQCWLSIARTHIEQGFMALNRAIFRPGRVALPEDETPEGGQ